MKVHGRARTTVWLLCMVATLAACGGGGGGGGADDGGGTRPLTVTISPATLSVTADAGAPSTPAAAVELTLDRDPQGDVYVSYDYAGTAISSAVLEASSETRATMRIYFHDPSGVGPGTYTDTLQIEVCRPQGENCGEQLQGSPRTIAVSYTVTGTQPPSPSMSATTSSVSASGLAIAWAGPTAFVGINFQNVGASSVSVGATSSTNGVGNAYYFNDGPAQGTVTIYFKPPRDLGEGVYNDVITLTGTCYGCTRPLVGSPLLINVQYTVSNTATGPEGYTLRVLDAVAANDLVWSEAHERLYFSSASSAPTSANSISALDPYTAEIQGSAFAGSEPGRLAASDDGQYLYVAMGGSNSIRRMTLPALAQDLLIPLGGDSSTGAYFASDLEVMPGQPNTIAVARSRSATHPDAAGVVIFDGATPRADIVGGPTLQPSINWLEFGADAAVLYGATSQNTSFSVSTLGVDADGVTLISQQYDVGTAFNFRDLHFDAGLVYADSGQVFDPARSLVVGTYSNPDVIWMRSTLPDSAGGKVFTLGWGSPGGILTVFDLERFTPLRSLDLNGLNISTSTKTRLVRWGADGLAFITDDGKIVLLNGPFVQ